MLLLPRLGLDVNLDPYCCCTAAHWGNSVAAMLIHYSFVVHECVGKAKHGMDYLSRVWPL